MSTATLDPTHQPQDGFNVTPDDANDLKHPDAKYTRLNATPARILYIGTAGNIHFQTLCGTELTIAVTAGRFDACTVRRIYDTDTTADNIVAFI